MGALPLTRLAAITPRNHPRPVPILDQVLQIEPARGLVGCTANDKVVGAGEDFVVGVRANDFEGEVFGRHGAGPSVRGTENEEGTRVKRSGCLIGQPMEFHLR